MEFITAEQFLEQPKEVQKVFIDWWNPSIGDLYLNTPGNREDFEQIVEVIYSQELANDAYNNKNCNMKESRGDYFPLLTEGQLRQFIEDKTRTKIDIEFYTTGYEIFASSDEYHIRTDNLFQAYWQVAIKIASEEVKEQ